VTGKPPDSYCPSGSPADEADFIHIAPLLFFKGKGAFQETTEGFESLGGYALLYWFSVQKNLLKL
jgi:hypothetical protein